MELQAASELINFIQSKTLDDEAELYDGYSGRGMYGKTTYGVTTSLRPQELTDIIENMDDEELEIHGLQDYYNRDNMGLDYIYY